MKRNLWIALMFVGVLTCAAFSMPRIEAQSTDPTNLFSSGPLKVSIATRSGQLLSSLDIPEGVEVGIFGNTATPANRANGIMMPVTFNGDVVITTRPRSDLVAGPIRDQMLAAPLRLDVKDTVVVVTR